VIAVAIVIYMLVRGLQFLHLDMLTSHPKPGLGQVGTGGFFDPIIGTFALTALGIVIATPVGVAIAVWLSEYGRPAWLARAVESGVEIVAGTPSIVLAIFGLLVFSQGFFSFLSFTSTGGSGSRSASTTLCLSFFGSSTSRSRAIRSALAKMLLQMRAFG